MEKREMVRFGSMVSYLTDVVHDTGAQQYDVMAPYNAGIAHDRTSGYEKFEVRSYRTH